MHGLLYADLCTEHTGGIQIFRRTEDRTICDGKWSYCKTILTVACT